MALVTMGEVLGGTSNTPQNHKLNIFHLILMHIISFDVFFLVGKTFVILRYCPLSLSIITFLQTKPLNAYGIDIFCMVRKLGDVSWTQHLFLKVFELVPDFYEHDNSFQVEKDCLDGVMYHSPCCAQQGEARGGSISELKVVDDTT